LSDRALLVTAREQVSADVRDIDDLVKRASNGNQAALNMLGSAGTLLGQEVANLVNILDPKLIIFSGEGVRMGEAFFKPLLDSLEKNIMPGLAKDTEIRMADWTDDVWARGAASVVIGELFNSPIQKEEA
jgi:predicted NBD/HSP70 family sugar kinase